MPKKTFTLTAPYDTYYSNPTGLPLITSKITIEGNGAKITRKNGSPNFRLMAVSPTGDLDLENLTLSGGSSSGNNGGGAIYNYGEITISNRTITGNTASYGGAVSNSGSLTVQNSTISKNTAKGYFYAGYYQAGDGGGIKNSGTLTITNSTITGNKAIFAGGIANFTNMEIDGSTVSKNSALYAGGIGNGGDGSITNSTTQGTRPPSRSSRLRAPITLTLISSAESGAAS